MPTPFVAQFTSPAAPELVVVSVLAVRGSAPRHAGAFMVVRADGSFSLSVGGGLGERAALDAAAAAFSRKRSALMEVEMLGERAEGAEMICGGQSILLVEYVTGPAFDAFRAAAARVAAGERVVLVRRLAAPAADGSIGVELSALDAEGVPIAGNPLPYALAGRFPRGGAARSSYAEAERVYFQVEDPEEKLLILGAGHVGSALARLAALVGFSVTVADERPAFADRSRFPAEVAVARGAFADIVAAFPFDGASSAVVVTPGHLKDAECVRAVFARRFRYLGMIGSARKTAMVRDRLRADGYPPELVDRLHAPVGLDIGAETPEEIAVSILAELISCRRGA